MSRFARVGASPSKPPSAAGAAGSSAASAAGAVPPRPPLPSALVPLCRGHSQPMNVFTSHKAESSGRRFFTCPLTYSSPNEKCRSFIWSVHDTVRQMALCSRSWLCSFVPSPFISPPPHRLRCSCVLVPVIRESDLLQAGHGGFRLAARAANGELLTECVVSLEIDSDTQFSAQIVPPNAALSALFLSEGGTIDHAALAHMNPLARQHPSIFLFPLQQHDALVATLHAQKTAGNSNLIVSPVPEHAMRALLTDIAAKEDAARAAEEAQAERTGSGQLNESAAKVAFSLTQAAAALSIAATATDSAVAAASGAASTDDEDAPIAPKKYRTILAGSKKKQTAKKKTQGAANGAADSNAAGSGMSAADECQLNVQLLVPQVRSALLPFQLEGVRYAVSKKGRCLIADEMLESKENCNKRRGKRRGIENSRAVRCACMSVHLSVCLSVCLFVSGGQGAPHEAASTAATAATAAAATAWAQGKGRDGHMSTHRCLFVCLRRLGKSLQAIAVAAYYFRDWPLLIICPSSLRLAWEDEICKVRQTHAQAPFRRKGTRNN